jgi:hypothetical protein
MMVTGDNMYGRCNETITTVAVRRTLADGNAGTGNTDHPIPPVLENERLWKIPKFLVTKIIYCNTSFDSRDDIAHTHQF